MNVCVFGAGNMGTRIAEVFLTNGHNVTMLDIKQEFIDRGVKTITGDLNFLVKKEKMTAERKDELLAGLKTSVDRSANIWNGTWSGSSCPGKAENGIR